MTIDLDNDERSLLLHMLNRATRQYEESEIEPVMAVGRDYYIWQCVECGNKGPTMMGITHGPTCFFRRLENLRVRLLAGGTT